VAYRLLPDEDLGEGVARIAAEELDSAIGELRDNLAEDPVNAIHSARKSLKKERALLRLVREAVYPDVYRDENEVFRDAGRRLSGTRDAQVALQTLDKLREHLAGRLPAATFDALEDALRSRTPRTGEGSAVRAVASAVAGDLEAARDRLLRWTGHAISWKQIERGLDRTYKRGRAALADVEADPDDEHLHEWRKRAKDLWYHQRVLHPLWPEIMEAQADRLDQLGELLGDDQDLANLRRLLTTDHSLTSTVADDLDPVVELIDLRRAQLTDEALRLGRRVYAESPKAYRERHQSYYRARGRPDGVPGHDTDVETGAVSARRRLQPGTGSVT
jgi:CHAD domain-containing protein